MACHLSERYSFQLCLEKGPRLRAAELADEFAVGWPSNGRVAWEMLGQMELLQ